MSVDDKLWNKLSDFVHECCWGRDESHGHHHMKQVAECSLEIASQMRITDEYRENVYQRLHGYMTLMIQNIIILR